MASIMVKKIPKLHLKKIKTHDFIAIDFWTQMIWNPSIATLQTLLDKGFKNIYNVNASYFYYVLREEKPDDGRLQHSFDFHHQDKSIYEDFTLGRF